MGAIGGIADLKKEEIDFSSLNRMRLAMSMRGRKRSSAYIGGCVDLIYNSSSPEAFGEYEDRQPAIFERSGGNYALSIDSDDLLSAAVFERYRTEGIDFLGRLQGGFALALFDGERRMLLLARDIKGKKPLFYRIYKGKIYFASEIKGVTEAIGERITISREVLSLHLTAPMGVYRAANIFTDIFEVLPGECLLFTELGMSRFRYREHLSVRSGGYKKHRETHIRNLIPYPTEDAVRIGDTLSEALIAFDYPQFDSDMPALCELLDSSRKKGKDKLLFEDSVRRRSISYAYEREDRLGGFYGICAEGHIPRVEPKAETDMTRYLYRYLRERFFSLSTSQLSLLQSILGAKKLECLIMRFEIQDEKDKDTEAKIRILGMLIQTVMWAESRELLIKSTGDGTAQSALSII